MTYEEYQAEAVKFRTPEATNEYLSLGLIEEVGELAGKFAKKIRDGVFDEKAAVKELGDVLWFIANIDAEEDKSSFDFGEFQQWRTLYFLSTKSVGMLVRNMACSVFNGNDYSIAIYFLDAIAERLGCTLEEVAEINIRKLRDRQARGVIHGNGDER